jgi:hypothetical protein
LRPGFLSHSPSSEIFPHVLSKKVSTRLSFLTTVDAHVFLQSFFLQTLISLPKTLLSFIDCSANSAHL